MRVHHYNSTPEPELIADELYRIVIPQPFYEPNNVYLINSGEPVLIDSGYIENLGLLQRALRSIGLSLSKIKHIVYTHDHIDHMSAALSIRFYTSARTYAMAGLEKSVENYTANLLLIKRAEERLTHRAHRDPVVRRTELARARRGWDQFLESSSSGGKMIQNVEIDHGLVQGDVLEVGRREIGFLHTPGHNCWHLTPYILGEGIYFTGDLVLDNVSSVYADVDGNLGDYHQSLARLSRIPVKRLLPAHGQEPADPHKKIRLLQKTLSLLERGVMRRLKERPHDLSELVVSAMGERVRKSGYYFTALGVVHSIIRKLADQGFVEVLEVDPPYEMYSWTGPQDA